MRLDYFDFNISPLFSFDSTYFYLLIIYNILDLIKRPLLKGQLTESRDKNRRNMVPCCYEEEVFN